MAFDSGAWIKRANEVVGKGGSDHASASEAVQFATSMLTALYGTHSSQLGAFSVGCEAIAKQKVGIFPVELRRHAYGAINNAKAELEAGLVGNLRILVTGEVLADLVGLGKEILADGTEVTKNVASVLIAAAFEDLMRRMGAEFAGVSSRPNLQEVINALKDAGVLKGGEIGTAQSLLKFRNDSLHADWANVSRAQIEACIGFVDALLVKHFS
jgi:hypothetical protein